MYLYQSPYADSDSVTAAPTDFAKLQSVGGYVRFYQMSSSRFTELNMTRCVCVDPN